MIINHYHCHYQDLFLFINHLSLLIWRWDMGPKLSNPNQWLNPNIDELLEVARSELTAPAPDLLEVLDSQPLLDGSPRNLRPEAG
jgi:hypothetical protein